MKKIIKFILGKKYDIARINIQNKNAIKCKNNCHRIYITKKEIQSIDAHFDAYINKMLEEINGHQATFPTQNIKNIIFDNYTIYPNEDYLGPVAFINGKSDKIYRLIKRESLQSFINLYETGFLQTLQEKGILPYFIISPYYLDNYPCILEINIIEINNTNLNHFDKFNALLFSCVLNEICKKIGVSLRDPHFGNMSINNGLPIYFDFGSFEYGKVNDDYTITRCTVPYMLLDYFPYSALSQLNKLRSRFSYFDLHYHYEANFYLRAFRKYHKKHSSKIIVKYIDDLFYRHNCDPRIIFILFHDDIALEKLSWLKLTNIQ